MASLWLGLLLAPACARPEPPNVALFVLDTARADTFSALGGPAGATPVFDRLAQDGWLFTAARSTSAWTVPSHGSLFTGLYPKEHGADHGHTELAADRTTLAELLASTHQTAGFSENPHIGQALGFAQGFTHFEETWRGQASAADIPPTTERVLAWLGTKERERPFFLFVNFMAPHLPYAPPPAFERRTVSPLLDRAVVEKLRGFSEWDARGAIAGLFQLSSDQIELLRALYQAEVSFADARVGQVLAKLAEREELDHTLVIVVSDHGENIGQHGLFEHQFALSETLLRIPMVLRLPGKLPQGVQSALPVQLVDVMPTVLEVLGHPRESWPRLAGVSLLSAPPSPRRPVLAQYARPVDHRWRFARVAPDFDFTPFDQGLAAVVMGHWKLVAGDSGAVQLFDLEADPGELRNLAGERPEIVAALTDWLASRGGERPSREAPTTPELDAEMRRALQALGYLD